MSELANDRTATSERESSPVALHELSRDQASIAEKPAPQQRELTLRAALAGCFLGALLAAANVYTGLKLGSVDGGNITAAVLGFAMFSRQRSSSRSYSLLENNLTQTVAASAALMSAAVGLLGPIPALELLGRTFPAWSLVAWGVALGVLGIVIAVALRSRLITVEKLPFPTGAATAEVLTAMRHGEASALKRARALFIAAGVAAAVTWLRDGPFPWLPQALVVASWGVSSLSVSMSPLMLSTGLLVGLPGAASMLLGSSIAWLLLAPALIRAGAVPASDYGQITNWLMWPAVALILSSSLTSLLAQWRSMTRGVLDLWKLSFERSRSRDQAVVPLVALALAALLAVGVLAMVVFEIGPAVTVLAIGLACLLAVVSARAAGETDTAPLGAMGGVTQVLFGASSHAQSLITGSIVTGAATQTAATLWAFKTGERVQASVRHQVIGQLLGACVGALVAVPTYALIMTTYGVGTERMPAPGVLSWKATAEAVKGGVAAFPPYAATAAIAALCVGCVLTLLGNTRIGRFIPSPVAIGIAFLLPLEVTATIFLGGLLFALLSKRSPTFSELSSSIAGGAIAGESLLAVVIAALLALGVLGT